jgi:hypothetical protein
MSITRTDATFKSIAATFLSCLITLSAEAAVRLAENGKPMARIIIGPDRNSQTEAAAEELATTLAEIVGAPFTVARAGARPTSPAIFVGKSPEAIRAFPEIDLSSLAPEEIVMKTRGEHLLLAGGGPRGDFYAVSRFLQEQCGVRWWTPWASRVPKNPDLTLGEISLRYRPSFELRHPYFLVSLDPQWAARNCVNGESKSTTEKWGGAVRYKGFVHTFYGLVPPEQHFATHPDWFSLVKGKRIHDRAQLCLTHPELRKEVVARVRQWLRESPDVNIISVSQNDWDGACECGSCRSVDLREGGPSGSLIDFVNHVAAQIEPDSPHVAVDTLAYQYTRRPPKSLRPRRNVIVRVCSNDCNYGASYDHPSNAEFAADLKGWAALTERIYVWDYASNFANLQPHPNWFTAGPKLHWFAGNKVKGAFIQGPINSHGAEMAELRAWVLGQLLWNPRQDERSLVREFVHGYYGPKAGPLVFKYLEFMEAADDDFYLTHYAASDSPFLAYRHLAPAEMLLSQAEESVKEDRELAARIRLARLPLRYVWLKQWEALRQEAAGSKIPWPLPDSRENAAEQWRAVVQGDPTRPWTQVTALNEAGLTNEDFLARKNLKK